MGLFATLAASAGGSTSAVGADGSGKSGDNSSSSSSTSLPTAVQLHSSHRIDFLSGGIDGRRRGPTSSAANSSGNSTTSTAKRRFETLSYQAVEVTAQQDGEGRSGGILQQQPNSSKAKKHQRPNLGIWDVRLPDTSGGTDGDKSTDLINRLLQKVISPGAAAPPTVIFALDLADPSSVYPAMEAMVAALLRRYEAMGADGASAKMSASASATTRLSKLRSTKFGAAPEQSEEVPSNVSGGGSADTDRIALIICCAVPPTPAEVGPEGGATGAPQSFQEKQAVSLVHYHLHRFAAEVDCTLAFVRPDDGGANLAASAPSGDEGGEGDNASAIAKSKGAIPSLTVTELGAVVIRVAQGMAPVVEEEKTNDDNDEVGASDDAEEAQEGGAAATAAGLEQPPIFAPGTHDDDLIGSVLLRNASCPGVWDAAKDDLWKALPSAKAGGGGGGQKSSDKKKDVNVGGAAADEAWLSKLAASLPAQGATGAGDDVSVKTSKSSKSSSATTSGSSSAKVSTKKKRVTRSTAAKADTKNDDPTSFFENLMKK